MERLSASIAQSLEEDALRAAGGSMLARMWAEANDGGKGEDARGTVVHFLTSWAWEELHGRRWDRVDMIWRQLYAQASCLAACILRANRAVALNWLDKALIMGAPTHRGLVLAAATELQKAHSADDDRQRRSSWSLPQTPPPVPPEIPQYAGRTSIDVVPPPSLVAFVEIVKRATPVIIDGALSHWPALSTRAWSDLSYIRRLMGQRTVPIEVGASYTHRDWTQRMVTVNEFIDTFILGSEEQDEEEEHEKIDVQVRDKIEIQDEQDEIEGQEGQESTSDQDESASHAQDSESITTPLPKRRRIHPNKHPRGYLAQHNLFDQVPELLADISIPDYCAVDTSDSDDDADAAEPVQLNAWFGPKGTVSPPHTDPQNNLLAQVVGYKYVRLFAPSERERLYPHDQQDMLSNTSRVDIRDPDSKLFPGYAEAAYWEAVIAPGQLLYIPRGWWHYVESLSPSFSVSFWFGPRD